MRLLERAFAQVAATIADVWNTRALGYTWARSVHVERFGAIYAFNQSMRGLLSDAAIEARVPRVAACNIIQARNRRTARFVLE